MKIFPIMLVFYVVTLLVILAGCGGGSSNHVRNLGGAYDEVKVQYNSHDLYCVRGHYSTADARQQWGGLSCDWVRYHRENG